MIRYDPPVSVNLTTRDIILGAAKYLSQPGNFGKGDRGFGPDGEKCILGALEFAAGLHKRDYDCPWSPITGYHPRCCLEKEYPQVVRAVAAALPRRARKTSFHLKWQLADFNNDPKTTASDVVKLLQKAAARLEKQA